MSARRWCDSSFISFHSFTNPYSSYPFLLQVCLDVLLNVGAYDECIEALGTWHTRVDSSLSVLVDLMQMYRDKPETFLKAAKILRTICRLPGTIKELSASGDMMKRLAQVEKLLGRRESLNRHAAGSGKGKNAPSSLRAIKGLLQYIEARKVKLSLSM